MLKRFAGMATAMAAMAAPVAVHATDAVRPVAAATMQEEGDGVSTGLLIAGGVAVAAVLAFVVFDGDDDDAPNSA